jgi:hypothetical protein
MITVLPSSGFRQGRWLNGMGVSWDIAAEPESAGSADFTWRFAIARIDADVPFSRYSGVDRIFTLIEGEGLTLALEGHAPLIIDRFSRCKQNSRIYFAGQVSGVEGYVESVASGLLCGRFAVRDALGLEPVPLPETTACGSLLAYIAQANWQDFRPSKFTFGLLPDDGVECRDKKRKKELKAERACEALGQWIKRSVI